MTAGQIYFILFLIVASDAVTWHIHTRFDEAAVSEQLKIDAAATKEAQEATNALVGASTVKLDLFASVTEALKDKYDVKHEKASCPLPDNAVRLLSETANAAYSATK